MTSRLRVLVAVHQLDLGGSQMNAVDLASGIADRGHQVAVAGPDGPLVEVLRERGVPHLHIELDDMAHAAPSYRRLTEVTRAFRPDLVHAYELTPSLLTYFGPHRSGVPMTMTINSMSIPDFMPGSAPLQVCNPVIAAAVRRRRGPLGVLEIPTDTVDQHPGFDGSGFRAEIGVADDELLVVAVSRFARVLKQQGLETAIRAAGRLGGRVRLALVGDGPAMPDLRALAEATNVAAAREVVTLTGMRPDPRSAYAAADVVLGMGGSLLRAMAFGKPCVVQGERFFAPLDATTAREFRWRGFYGIGPNRVDDDGEDRLVEVLDRLLSNEARRKENAEFALALVRQYYSLGHAVELQLDWYRRVLAEHRTPSRRELAATAVAVGSWVADRAVKRRRGTAQEDYFNSENRIRAGFVNPVPPSFTPDQVR